MSLIVLAALVYFFPSYVIGFGVACTCYYDMDCNLNMMGRYSFTISESVARGELQPLRKPSDGDA